MKEVIGLIGGRSGEALTDSLHKKDIQVALIIGKKDESGYEKAEYVLESDLSKKEDIYNFFSNKGVKNIVIGTGHILAFELAEYLEKRNLNVSVNIEASYLCKDKYVFKSIIEKLNIKTPKYLLIKENSNLNEFIYHIQEQIKLPCVIKSTIDRVQPELVYEKELLIEKIENILRLNSDVLIEEYIDGSDCTVPVKSDGKRINSLEVLYWSKAKELNLKGFKNPRANKLDKSIELRLKSLSEKIVRELNILGVPRVDYIVKNDEIYVLEVNSVIVSSHESTAMPMYRENNINIADEIINTAIDVFSMKME